MDQLLHILRDRGRQVQDLTRHRVGHLQPVGVKGRAGDEIQVLRPIEPVPRQGMADGGHMDPELVGAAGLGNEFQKAMPFFSARTS